MKNKITLLAFLCTITLLYSGFSSKDASSDTILRTPNSSIVVSTTAGITIRSNKNIKLNAIMNSTLNASSDFDINTVSCEIINQAMHELEAPLMNISSSTILTIDHGMLTIN